MGAQRDEAGFAAFVTEQWQGLVRLGAGVAGSLEAGEDAAQAALARVWVRWPTVGEDRQLAYARRAVLNEVLARRRRRSSAELPTADYPEVGVSDGAADRAEAAVVRARLAELPPRSRAVVILRHVDDLSVAEVSRLLGISEGAVKSMNARALAQLRAVMERENQT